MKKYLHFHKKNNFYYCNGFLINVYLNELDKKILENQNSIIILFNLNKNFEPINIITGLSSNFKKWFQKNYELISQTF